MGLLSIGSPDEKASSISFPWLAVIIANMVCDLAGPGARCWSTRWWEATWCDLASSSRIGRARVEGRSRCLATVCRHHLARVPDRRYWDTGSRAAQPGAQGRNRQSGFARSGPPTRTVAHAVAVLVSA